MLAVYLVLGDDFFCQEKVDGQIYKYQNHIWTASSGVSGGKISTFKSFRKEKKGIILHITIN